MDLIDWPLVARSALWILGLSVIVAAWSYASYWATVHGERHRVAFGRPGFLLPFAGGMALFCAGLAWGAASLVERILWIALLLGFLYMGVSEARRARSANDCSQATP